MEAIDKLRSIVNWANSQCEHLNYQFKSIKDIEKSYDFCKANNIEFLDSNYIINELEEDEQKKVLAFLKKLNIKQ